MPANLSSLPDPPLSRIVEVLGVRFGGPDFAFIFGPCATESRWQLLAAARAVKAAGLSIMRAGASKPRADPRSFQGVPDAIELIAEVKRLTGLGFVTEPLTVDEVFRLAEVVDMLQVGARNMHNAALLRAVGQAGLPVLLKRGLSATLDEFVHAAEYVLNEGNDQVVLCERGFRDFASSTRATLDLAAVLLLKARLGLPVIVDPSHAAGRADVVLPLAKAAAAAGADGLIVEAHPDPGAARSDSAQQIPTADIPDFMREVRAVAAAVGRGRRDDDDAPPAVLAW